MLRWLSALTVSALVATVASADDLTASLGEVSRQLREGHRSEALELARGLAEKHPDSLDANVRYQDLARRSGEKGTLVARYAARAKDQPKSALARYLHARVLMGKRAIAEYRAALRLDESFVPAWVGLSRALESEGRSAEAETSAREAIAIKRSSAPAHNALGWILEQRGDAKGAEESYRIALDCDEKYAPARLNRAHLLARSGKVDDALKEIDRVKKESPGDPQVYVHRGIVLASAGRNKEAAAAYEQAVKEAPEDALLLVLLAESYIELSEWALVSKALSRAATLDPKYAPVPATRGFAALSRGNFEKAIDSYKDAIRLDKKDTSYVYELAYAYEKAGKLKNAVREYKRAAKQDSENVLYRLALGSALEQAGEPKKAAAAYKGATKLDPKDVDAWLRYGHVSSEIGKPKDAVKALTTALTLAPENVEVLKTLGVIHETDLGKPKKAIEYYREYLAKGGKDKRVAEWLKELETGK